MKVDTRIILQNGFDKPQVLYLEPWGEDYTLLPSDEFEVIAKDVEKTFYFRVDLAKVVNVWAEGDVTDIGVYKDGSLLQCGHNRIDE